MDEKNKREIENFLYPQGHYHGEFTPENLAFNANLQEFAQRVSVLCGLEMGGQLSPDDTYKEIRKLWKQLKRSKEEFLDAPRPPKPDLPPEG